MESPNQSEPERDMPKTDEDSAIAATPNHDAKSNEDFECSNATAVDVVVSTGENQVSEKPEKQSRVICLGSRKWKILLFVFHLILLTAGGILVLLWQLTGFGKNAVAVQSTAMQEAKCQPLKVHLCLRHRISYAHTLLPNALGHVVQEHTNEFLNGYDSLISVKCFALLPLYLCSVTVPKCTNGVTVPPCRSLCHEVVRKCDFFLAVFTLNWPVPPNCDDLPDESDPDVCVGHQEHRILKEVAQACIGAFRCDRTRCIPHSWVCDTYPDCHDNADERNCSTCPPPLFHCSPNKCINQSQICDGIKDCQDNRDERNCWRLTGHSGGLGDGRLDVYHYETKEWQPVCGEGWKQDEYSEVACRALGYKGVAETRLKAEIYQGQSRLAKSLTATRKPKSKLLFGKFKGDCANSTVYVYLKCKKFECGRAVHSPTPRIVGGYESVPGKWPWLVALHGGPDQVFFCGGVLISPWWILSAAHCVGNQMNTNGWTIRLGMTRRTASLNVTQTRSLTSIIKHPSYNSGSLYSNDIALMLLGEPVSFLDYLRPSCLPQPTETLEPGTICTVIGWGKPLHGDEADYQVAVHEVEVPIISFNVCSQWYSTQDATVSDSMLCAGYPEGKKDACQGDSGGPLLCQNEETGQWTVLGVVSWGIKCAQPNLPGIYTNVPLYVDWIIQTAKEYQHPIDWT